MLSRLTFSFLAAAAAATTLAASPSQSPVFLSADDIRPGMVGIGRTIFNGDQQDEFKANILGVLHNIIGPGRDLILAKLEGGPLANTGVIAGMSGSPVYIDGKLIGAVSYSLGSFPKEPFAGITPIAEMTAAVDVAGPRTSTRDLGLTWPATPAQVFSSLQRLVERAAAPLRMLPRDTDVFGPASLVEIAPGLRPIGTAFVLSGFDPGVDAQLRDALSATGARGLPQGSTARAAAALSPLRAGDPVGVTLIRGDLEMGATGTVTHVDGGRVYAFGHPFLNLGPTEFPMTQARVIAVLPSLDSSMKIATLGPVIGTMLQDRATAIGGKLGAGPREVEVAVTLSSEHAPDHQFSFRVLRDQLLTPLFTYVAVLNALSSYERQAGVLSIAASGTVSFGTDGDVALDDFFSGDNALTQAAAAMTASVGIAATNEFRATLPEKVALRFAVGEHQESSTIERVWLDTTRPKFGGTHMLQILLRNYRGGTETVSMPVTMPEQASGQLTLLVSDGAALAALEKSELKPGVPGSFRDLLTQLNTTRRNNRIYVRLLTSTPGSVVSGQTLPALPSSVRSVLDTDKSVASSSLSRSVVGSWEQRLTRSVKGARELPLTLISAR